MSTVLFHAQDGGAKIRGSERAHMGLMTSDLAISQIRLSFNDHLPRWQQLLGIPINENQDTHFATRQAQIESVKLHLRHNDHMFWRDHKMDQFSLLLNTALALGSDPVKLMARLHGQCEIHCWTEGEREDRDWLAHLIGRGLQSGVMRAKTEGWEELIAWLDAGIGPVVCSYSGSDYFPNSYVSNWVAPKDDNGEPMADDGWYDLPEQEQWDLSMAYLREHRQGLKLDPERWEYPDYHFGHALTVMDIEATDWEERIAYALALELEITTDA